jgi:hypothetical protein
VEVLQVQVTNSSTIPVTLTNLTLSASGTGDDQTGLSSVQVYLDVNGNGTFDNGVDSWLSTATYSTNDGIISIMLNSVVPAGSSVNYLVVDNFTTTAPDGTYVVGVNVGGLSGTCAYGSVQFSGLSVTGAAITIVHATPVPTETPTATITVVPVTTTVVVYPNPSDGSQPVSWTAPGRVDGSDINVQIFTTAFRLVQQIEVGKTSLGAKLEPIKLEDKTGKPLASGLYYVVVTVDSKKSIGKLLILR